MIVAGNHVTHSLERYVPRVAVEWDADAAETWREVDGTLVFVDISGFTALSERLAKSGRIGAEELTDVLNRVFSAMLDLAYARGGALLKFGGDALLLLFTGSEHAVQATSAAVEMRSELRRAAEWRTSVGRLGLRMSVGVHSGLIHLFRVGRSHTELLIAGPGATMTTEMETTAEAGDIVISPATRALLRPGAAVQPKGAGWLLRWRKAPSASPGEIGRVPVDAQRMMTFVPVVLREHLRHGRAEPEHRLASIGFLKFKGTDELMATRGASAVAAALEEIVGTVQDAAEEEAVAFLASDIDSNGGKIILATGVPVAQEDDEGRMLRTLRRIAERGTELPLRIGVNRGHVFAGEVGTAYRCAYTVMGDTVNLAARLMAAAQPGEVYATPHVLDSSRTLFQTAALEPFYVKGKSAPVHAYAVGPEAGTRPVDATTELPFTGRDAELAALRAELEKIYVGRGSLAVIMGGRGLGKTRLVHEALAAFPEMTVVEAHAQPYATATPYRALRDPFRRILGIEESGDAPLATRLTRAVEALDPSLLSLLPLIGDIAHITTPGTPEVDEIEPRFRRDRLADVVERLLDAALPAGAAIVVDDAHWLDEASGHLLARLATSADQHRWALVAIRREAPRGFTPDDAIAIELAPLKAVETRALVLAATAAAPLRPHDVELVARRSGGNPLFVQEIVRAARDAGSIDAIPESLEAVVSTQIDSLPPLPRRALRYASVLGLRVPRALLEDISAADGLQLDAASRRALAEFLEPDGRAHLRFRHAMLQEVAYEGLSYTRRRQLHAATGAALERLHSDDPEQVADLLSLHYSRAQDHAKAWRYARVAGDGAMHAYANVEAATHYERALAAARRVPEIDPRDLAAVWTVLGDVRERSGEFEAALDAYRRASRLVKHDAVEVASTLLKRARARERAGAFSLALRELTHGSRKLEGLDRADAGRVRARLLALGASVRQAQGKHHEALTVAEAAAVEARRTGDDAALARAYAVMDWANLMLGRLDRAGNAIDALGLYERLGDLDGQAGVMTTLGAEAYFHGRWTDAVEWYSRSREALLRAGNTWQAAGMGVNVGEVLVNQGRLDEAEPVLRDASRVLRAAGFPDGASFADMQLGRLLAGRGELEEAERLLEGARGEFARLGIAGTALEAAVHLAETRTRRGDATGALELLERAIRAAGDDAAVLTAAVARVTGAALSALGRVAEADAQVARGLAAARDHNLPYEEALLLRTKVDIDRAAGRKPDAIDLTDSEQILRTLAVGEHA
jgi:class 3 adenylate cyclase/tetratricopeptide (TPR) repeat protein